jgi:hypothetical protein
MFRKAMKRRTPFGLVGSLALLCLLIAGEALAVVHSLDVDAHAGADPCKICISISALDDAAVAAPPTLVPSLAVASDVFPEAAGAVFARAERPCARGPPQAS